MNRLYIKNIEKAYETNKEENKNFLLKIDDLQIKNGEIFGLIGASGCGKTTLLKIIAGLYSVDKGKVYIDDNDITNIPAEKRDIGMVFQQPLLFPHRTVEENISFGLKIKKVNKVKIEEKVKEILKTIGLEGFEKRYPRELSGGQQQRVSIARAIVLNPNILLMDEPFSALDPNLREEMRELILRIHKKYKITIVFVTHDREEAFILFDRMAIMQDGKVLQIDSPKELYEKPNSIYVSKFLGAKNIFYGKVINNKFISDRFEINFKSKHDEQNGYIIIRPETLDVKKIDNEQGNNNLYGIIEKIFFRQGYLYISVSIDDKLIQVSQKSISEDNFNIGENVIIEYNPKQIYFIKD